MTEMLLKNYSQLAVTGELGEVVGAVTWRSVAIALSRGDEAVASACDSAETVFARAELLPLATRIYDYDFVLVTTEAGQPLGIVTTADLTLTFAEQAGLFLQLGEIDRNLRTAISSRFTVEGVAAVFAETGEKFSLASFDEATMGQYERILAHPMIWEAVGWPLDRESVRAAINTARRVRNHVMHFNDGATSEDDRSTVDNLVELLRRYT